MKTTVLSATLAALALATTAAPAQARSQRCANVNEAQIAALFDQFNAAWASRNPDRVADLFGPDATLLATVAATPRIDRAGIRDYFVGFLQGAPQGTITSSNIEIGCNIATRVGLWTVRFSEPQPSEVKARFTFIYKYQNGKWVIEHLHSSVLPDRP